MSTNGVHNYKKLHWRKRLLILSHFSNGKGYECDKCSLLYASFEALLKHKKHNHRNENRAHALHHCPSCSYSTSVHSSYRRHVMIHTGEKPHKCPQCSQRFIQKPALKTHMRIHTGERPYICDICNLGFAFKSSLKRHRKGHSKEKYILCRYCSKSFIQSNQLKKHKCVDETTSSETKAGPCV